MFQLDFASRVPIYEQLYTNIIQLASADVLKAGDRLPSVRTLASQLGVNPNTVAKAYRELEANGYIQSTVGRGSFITEKLTENNSQKQATLESFREAVVDAHKHGIVKEQLIAIVKEVFEGSRNND